MVISLALFCISIHIAVTRRHLCKEGWCVCTLYVLFHFYNLQFRRYWRGRFWRRTNQGMDEKRQSRRRRRNTRWRAGIILTVSRYLSKCMISRSVSLDQLLIRLLSIRWYIFKVCFWNCRVSAYCYCALVCSFPKLLIKRTPHPHRCVPYWFMA